MLVKVVYIISIQWLKKCGVPYINKTTWWIVQNGDPSGHQACLQGARTIYISFCILDLFQEMQPKHWLRSPLQLHLPQNCRNCGNWTFHGTVAPQLLSPLMFLEKRLKDHISQKPEIIAKWCNLLDVDSIIWIDRVWRGTVRSWWEAVNPCDFEGFHHWKTGYVPKLNAKKFILANLEQPIMKAGYMHKQFTYSDGCCSLGWGEA